MRASFCQRFKFHEINRLFLGISFSQIYFKLCRHFQMTPLQTNEKIKKLGCYFLCLSRRKHMVDGWQRHYVHMCLLLVLLLCWQIFWLRICTYCIKFLFVQIILPRSRLNFFSSLALTIKHTHKIFTFHWRCFPACDKGMFCDIYILSQGFSQTFEYI